MLLWSKTTLAKVRHLPKSKRNKSPKGRFFAVDFAASSVGTTAQNDRLAFIFRLWNGLIKQYDFGATPAKV